MNKMQIQRLMSANRKAKATTNYSNLQLSAQVKDVLSSYHRKGTWKSKTGKMTKTLTGETLDKPNAMTEDDIDKLFQNPKQKTMKVNTEQIDGPEILDYTKLVRFLQIDDGYDKLLTGLADVQDPTNNYNQFSATNQGKKDLTSEFKKNYMVGKVVGEGAYASVRVAIHRLTNKKVAIKVYEKSKIKEVQRKKAVRREIKIMQILKHPNIVHIIDVVETNNHLNISMEYLSGMSLGGYLKSHPNGRIGERDCKLIFKGLTEALVYMHARNIAHRDIKLENIILKEDLFPKLIDFGFSTCIQPGKKMKIFCGTPSYMAPEVVQRKEYRGESADIWALGVLLFVSLTGLFPFKGATDQELYNKINSANYSKMELMFSQWAMDLVSRMLTIQPDSRITAYQILMHPWMSGSSMNLSSTLKISKKSKEKSVEKPRKRVCTISSMNSHSMKEGKWALKTNKTGLIQTCKQNLQEQIRLALKSPKACDDLFSYRKIDKQNHVRHRTRMDTRPLEETMYHNRIEKEKKPQLFNKNQAKVIDLLRVEMKKRTVENTSKSKSKSNKRI